MFNNPKKVETLKKRKKEAINKVNAQFDKKIAAVPDSKPLVKEGLSKKKKDALKRVRMNFNIELDKINKNDS